MATPNDLRSLGFSFDEWGEPDCTFSLSGDLIEFSPQKRAAVRKEKASRARLNSYKSECLVTARTALERDRQREIELNTIRLKRAAERKRDRLLQEQWAREAS